MKKIAKKVGGIILAAAILVGVYSGYQAIENYMDSKISIERGKYEAISAEYNDYKKDARKRLEELSEEVAVLNVQKSNLLKAVGDKTREIRAVRKTITDLEEAGRNLTDVNDKLYNANLQIQEYKKLVSMYEQRFVKCRMTIITQEEIIKRCIATAQEFEQLYLNEEHLKKTCESRLSLAEKRLGWEKMKFKGSAVIAVAAGGFILYNEIRNAK